MNAPSLHRQPTGAHRQRVRAALRRQEGGFTLIELVVALAVLAIIIVPLTAAFITTLQQTNAVDQRLSQSADAQRIGSAWTKDVRSVDTNGYDTAGTCQDPTGSSPAETLLTSFEWGSDPTSGGNVKKASWVIEGTGPSAQLVRLYCENGNPVDEALIADSFGVAGKEPLEVIHSTNGPLDRDVCTSTTCTIVVDGAFKYQVTVARGVSGNDTGSSVQPLPPAIAGAVCGNGSLTVSWLPTPQPEGTGAVTNFRVVVTNSNGDTVNGSGNGDLVGPAATAAQVSGLTNGQDYWIQVQALVGSTPGNLSTPRYGPIAPCPSVPTAPTALVVTRADMGLNVSWTAPSDNGGSAINGWRIRARVAATDEVIGDVTVVGPSSGVVTGLINGTEYEVTVAAINLVGEGAESAGVKGTPSGVPFAPGAPSLTTSGDQVTVQWTEPENNGAPITSYKVYATPAFVSGNPTYPSSPWTVTAPAETDPPTFASMTFTTPPLPTGQRTFTVSAINIAGEGPQSGPSTATTSLGRPTLAPGDIQALPLETGRGPTDKGLRVTWVPIPDVPLYNGGSSVTGYRVTLSPADNNGFSVYPVNGANSTGLDIGNLTQVTGGAYKNYTVKVQAVNQVGPGLENPSDPANDATAEAVGIPGGVPIASPTNVAVTPLALVADPAGPRASARVSWTIVEDIQINNGDNSICTGNTGTRGYRVTYTPNDLNGQNSALVDGCFVNNADIGNLQRGREYTFKVVALNREGSSLPATTKAGVAPAPMTTPPSSSVILSRPVGSEGSRLSLTLPDVRANSGSPIPDYSATCATSSGSPTLSKTFSGLAVGTNLLSDPALVDGRTYRCTMSATATYPVAPNDTVTQISAAAIKVFSAPGAPTSVTAIAAASGKAKVDWVAPTNNGGDPVTGYTITTSPAIAGSPFTLANVSTWTSPTLTFGTSYTFSVAAVNGCGCAGGLATASNAFSPSSSLPSVAPTGLASAPTASGSPTPTTGITVSWAAFPTDGASTGGVAITNFVVTLTPNQSGTSTVTTTVAGTATSANLTVPQLQTGGTAYRTYTATVVARNVNGDGPTGSLSGARAGGIPLESPTALVIEPLNQNGAVRLKFTQPPYNSTSGGGVVPIGYRIFWKTPSGPESSGYSIGGAQTQTDLGFPTNTQYILRIGLQNEYGTSLTTETVTFTTPGAITVPTAPTVATSGTSGRLNLNVTAFATSASTPAVTTYAAACTSSNGGVAAASRTVTVGLNSINGLTPGRTYTCTVTGTSAGWAGSTTQTKDATTNAAVAP